MLQGGGNSVAEIREETLTCEDCQGNKKIYFQTRADLRRYLERTLPLRWKSIYHAMFQEWRKDKMIVCLCCEGRGTVEIWR